MRTVLSAVPVDLFRIAFCVDILLCFLREGREEREEREERGGRRGRGERRGMRGEGGEGREVGEG